MNIPIKNPRTLWVAALVLLAAATIDSVYAQQSTDKATSPGKNKSSSLSEKKDGEIITDVPVIVMVPMRVSNDLAMEKGCWVKLYDKKNYQGDSMLLVGPVNLAQMIGPFGHNWENKVRSIESGPNANVIIYDNRNFRDEDRFIDVNSKIPDLSKRMGFFDNFRSMMLNCI